MADNLLFTLRNVWLGAFPLVWLGGVIAIVLLAKKAKRDPAGHKRRFIVLWCTFLVYIVGSATVTGLANGVVRQRYQRMLDTPHRAIVFYTPKRRDMVNPHDQRAFIEALRSGDDVAAHHSSPIDKLEFGFAGDRRIFSLGRDSGAPDEYWVELERSPVYGEQGTPELRHFHSPAMTAWFEHWRAKPLPRGTIRSTAQTSPR
ncbi:MAG TPA: hypothetical protein V6D47_11810 [Oscillatoriaceae cyanobacterium]